MKSFYATVLCCVFASCGGQTTTASKGFRITVSGEAGATEGYAFPPTSDQEVSFVDGWSLRFDSVVVVLKTITLSENPDKSSTDQSQTGDLVAQLDGPWVVDLAKEGPLEAKEMNGKAFEVGTIENQNKKGNAAFDPTQKYALGFTMTDDSTGATNLNAVGSDVISAMQAGKFSVWMKGTAEFKGTSCRSSDATYDFNRLPKKINFSFGWKAPVNFKNCINPELMPADSRGVQPQKDAITTAQLTFHLDHPFWESLEEDAPLRFDLVAAQASVPVAAVGPASADLSETALTTASFETGKDKQGVAIPWRYCGEQAASERTTGSVSYDPHGVAVSPQGGAAGLANLYEYMRYNLSTMGHLNNDGLCFPMRQFAAP